MSPKQRPFTSARRWYQPVAWLVVITLCFGNWNAGLAQDHSQRSMVDSCAHVSEDEIKDELNRVTQTMMAQIVERVNLTEALAIHWNSLDIDGTIAVEVDKAINEIKEDAGWWEVIRSGWSSEKAEELTARVVTLVFGSQAVQGAINTVGERVAEDLAGEIEVFAAESGSVAFACLKTFIEGNHAAGVVLQLETIVSRIPPPDPEIVARVAPDVDDLVRAHGLAVGGVGVAVAGFLARSLVVKIVQQVATRTAGAAVGALFGGPFVIGTAVIGLVLVGADLWQTRDGALPIIRERLTGHEVGEMLQTLMAEETLKALQRELPILAREIATDLAAYWDEAQRDLLVMMELADKSEHYFRVLDQVITADQLNTLQDVTGALLEIGGESAVFAAAENGSLERSTHFTGDLGQWIRCTGSLADALDWATISPGFRDEVTKLELCNLLPPKELSEAELGDLLTLDNADAIRELAGLPLDALKPFLGMAPSIAVQLSEQHSNMALEWLGESLSNLTTQQRTELIDILHREPTLLSSLQTQQTLPPMATQQSMASIVYFWNEPDSVQGLVTNLLRLMQGKVQLSVFRVRYSSWPGAANISSTVLVLLVLWLAFSIAKRALRARHAARSTH